MATPEELEQLFEETVTAMHDVVTGGPNATITLPGGATVRSLQKIDKDAQDLLAATISGFGDTKVDKTSVDASDGIPGLSGFKLKLKNAAGTIVSTLASLATAARQWSLPDKDGVIALVSDITDRIGAANGIAPLDGNSLIPSTYLPSYVDDVLQFDTKAELTALTVGQGGQTKGKIYVVDADESDGGATNQYRWSGSAYVKMVQTPGTTDAVVEGATNKYFTNARAIAAPLTGLSLASAAVVAAADSIVVAIGKLQQQLKVLPFDFTAFVPGKPAASGKVFFLKFARAVTIPANFSGSKIEALTAATAATSWIMTKNGSQVGTISWAIGGTIPTMTTTGGNPITIAIDDKIILTAAASQDSTLADIGVAIAANLT